MSEIYNIIDKKKLDIVNKPINKAHGLPNECYTNKEYTLIESKKLSEQKKTKFELIEVSKPVEKVLAMARKFL